MGQEIDNPTVEAHPHDKTLSPAILSPKMSKLKSMFEDEDSNISKHSKDIKPGKLNFNKSNIFLNKATISPSLVSSGDVEVFKSNNSAGNVIEKIKSHQRSFSKDSISNKENEKEEDNYNNEHAKSVEEEEISEEDFDSDSDGDFVFQDSQTRPNSKESEQEPDKTKLLNINTSIDQNNRNLNTADSEFNFSINTSTPIISPFVNGKKDTLFEKIVKFNNSNQDLALKKENEEGSNDSFKEKSNDKEIGESVKEKIPNKYIISKKEEQDQKLVLSNEKSEEEKELVDEEEFKSSKRESFGNKSADFEENHGNEDLNNESVSSKVKSDLNFSEENSDPKLIHETVNDQKISNEFNSASPDLNASWKLDDSFNKKANVWKENENVDEVVNNEGTHNKADGNENVHKELDDDQEVELNDDDSDSDLKFENVGKIIKPVNTISNDSVDKFESPVNQQFESPIKQIEEPLVVDNDVKVEESLTIPTSAVNSKSIEQSFENVKEDARSAGESLEKSDELINKVVEKPVDGNHLDKSFIEMVEKPAENESTEKPTKIVLEDHREPTKKSFEITSEDLKELSESIEEPRPVLSKIYVEKPVLKEIKYVDPVIAKSDESIKESVSPINRSIGTISETSEISGTNTTDTTPIKEPTGLGLNISGAPIPKSVFPKRRKPPTDYPETTEFKLRPMNNVSRSSSGESSRRVSDGSSRFKPFMKSSPIIPIYSPDNKRISKKLDTIIPTFSSMSSPVSDNLITPNANPYASSFSPKMSSLAASPNLERNMITYSPSANSMDESPIMSPTTRERVTGEIKQIYNNRSHPSSSTDLLLPFHSLNKERFPNTPKLDPSKKLVFAVCLCDFNHLRGPEIEYWIDENGELDINESPESFEKLSKKWPILPFQALPDGSHDFEETFSYFNVLYDEKTGYTLNNICDTEDYKNLKDFSKFKFNSNEVEKKFKKNDNDSTFEDLKNFNENISTLWAISCVRRISSDEISIKSPNVTRTAVQKSIVILCRQPIFGQLKEKLNIITKTFFMQKDFNDKSLLKMLFDNLNNLYDVDKETILKQQQVKSLKNINDGINSVLRETDFYVGLNLKEFIHKFKRNSLVIFKSLLLEKRILFFSKNIEKLCNYQLSLISLIPNLITHLNDCGSPFLNFLEFNLIKSLNLQTSNRYSLLSFLGLPLQPFGLKGIFNPYVPLQQLDDTLEKDKINHYVIGSSNELLLDQKEKFCDILINLDTNSLEIIDKDLTPSLNLSGMDKKFIDLIIKTVDFYYYNNKTNEDDDDDEFINDETNFQGSDDYIRLGFEDYLIGLLSSIKYDKFLNKLGYKKTFENEMVSPQRNPIINKSMLVDGIDLNNIDNFNLQFIKTWLITNNYKSFDRLTDNEIFYVFDPLHVAMTEVFLKKLQEFNLINPSILENGLNLLRANVQSRIYRNTNEITEQQTPRKFSSLDSGSFSIDDLNALNSINDEIESINQIKKKPEEKKSWISSWGWGKK